MKTVLHIDINEGRPALHRANYRRRFRLLLRIFGRPDRSPLQRLFVKWVTIIVLLGAVFAGASGQDDRVTDNDVIRVAERMYCPVCENIPLDDCETTACVEWKAEIRAQLAEGRSDQEVIDSFVARFGDNVVGVPQDPVLRALTVLMPLLATALAVGAGVFTFRRFGVQPKLSAVKAPTPDGEMSGEAYRQRLEDDVRGRR